MLDSSDDAYYRYSNAGTLQSTPSVALAPPNDNASGITHDGEGTKITDSTDDRIYRGINASFWNLTTDNVTPVGITTDRSDYYYVVDNSRDYVYTYALGAQDQPDSPSRLTAIRNADYTEMTLSWEVVVAEDNPLFEYEIERLAAVQVGAGDASRIEYGGPNDLHD